LAFNKLIKCPICRVPNRFGDEKCKICQNDLPQQEEQREAPDPVQEKQEKARPPQPRAEPHKRSETRRRVKRLPKRQPSAKEGAPKRKGPPPRRRPGPNKRQQRPPPGDKPAGKPRVVEKKSGGGLANTNFWLVCDPLPPIPVGRKPTLTAGRSDECDLVLPHKEVSRVHGLIKVRGKTLVVYEDEGSSNGSYLNGRRISSSSLKVGDTLTLGPYEVSIRSNEEMAAPSAGESTASTKAFQLTAGRNDPNAVMSGNLREIPLGELFQALEFNKRTGTLTVLTPKLKGTLVVSKGQPISCEFGKLNGRDAVLAMMSFSKGNFSLASSVPEGLERTMSCTLTSLLFEASRQKDEEGHDGEDDAA
jgi:pSer/pThr/pTyr-binding forkhead associated (FHA) protein